MRFRTDPRLSRPVQPFCAPSRCHRQESNLQARGHEGLSFACLPSSTTMARFKALDSNEDGQIQSLLCYRLHQP